MISPYKGLPTSSFWRSGVADVTEPSPPGIYKKKFDINHDTQIATAGSCFAQHIGNALRARGYSVINTEPGPPGLSINDKRTFGYGTYSARYGNIYTVRQFLQLFDESHGLFTPALSVWKKDGRYYDALRPSVEPSGLASSDLVVQHRTFHLRNVRKLFRRAEVMVFTLGLTEAWRHRESGTVYPTAPGTIAGSYDPEVFEFVNFDYNEIQKDFNKLYSQINRINPGIKFVITVSPVPLAATATNDHVLSASTYSKAVLRAVAGSLSNDLRDVDYFPSYEIITGSQTRGQFFEQNLRSVTPEGVATVMQTFFSEHDSSADRETEHMGPTRVKGGERLHKPNKKGDDVVCEDALLEAFLK